MNSSFTTLETASMVWGGIILTAIIFSIYISMKEREAELEKRMRYAPKKNFLHR